MFGVSISNNEPEIFFTQSQISRYWVYLFNYKLVRTLIRVIRTPDMSTREIPSRFGRWFDPGEQSFFLVTIG